MNAFPETLIPSQELPGGTVIEEPGAKLRMPDRLWRTISSFPTLMVAILIAKVYWTCRDNIADPDLWWHLRHAQYLLTNLRFPNVDTYSFTAAGLPRLNYDWLPEIFYYGAFRAFGLQGVFILFASVLAVLVVAVFSLCRKETKDPLAAAVATIFGGLLAMVGFAPRTQTFGWLCFVGIYAILLRFRSGRRAPLWLIPVLFCVWLNCHGSWPIGIAIYGIFVLAGLVRRDVGRLDARPWSDGQLKQLIATGLASIGALFVNPLGYRLVFYPVEYALRLRLSVASVEEWASVNFNDPRGKLVVVVIGAIFATALIGRKRWRVDDAILMSFVLYCGLTHIRFLVLAGIVLPPILAGKFGQISSYDPRQERRLANSVLLAVVACFFVFGFPSSQRLNSEISSFFPVRAVEFLRAHPQPGHIFNLYEWGGYLEWNLPQAPTFIDSRIDIFEEKGVLKDYMDVATLNNSQEILDRYQVKNVLYPAGRPLSYLLSKSSQWQRIYSDGQSVIYRRLER